MTTNLKEKEDYFFNPTEYLIKKITMKANRAIIEYSNDDEFKTNECKFKVKDDITENFKILWNEVKEIIIALTPALYKEAQALKINAISFNYDHGYLNDVSIVAVWTIDDNGHILNLNYNNYPIYREEFAEDVVAISGKHIDLLLDILSSAKKYMNGETITLEGGMGLRP